MILYLIMGVLLLNGMPHFTAGAGGQVFRSPWNRYAPPAQNLMYGAANFAVVAVLAIIKLSHGAPTKKDLLFLLIGAGIAVVMFGYGARRFFDDRGARPESVVSERQHG